MNAVVRLLGRAEPFSKIVIALVLASAAVSTPSAAETGAAPHFVPRTLVEYRHQTELPVFEPRSLSIRWIEAISGIDARDVPTTKEQTAGRIALLWRDKNGLTCDCAGKLKPDEVLVSTEPVHDSVSGLAISIDEPTYVTFAEQTNYPQTALELDVATMANLAYANNKAPLRAFLDEHGFVLDYAYGMLNAGGLVDPQNLHLFVAHKKSTGDVFVAIRGTADVGDMITNFSTAMVPWKNGGMVHKGFSQAAAAAAALVHPVLSKLHHQRPEAPIYAVGHSLGAAIAVFLSLDLADVAPVHVLGLAMPPLGDAAFAKANAKVLAEVESYFVAHDEIRSLAYLAHRHNLEWVGHEIDLRDIGLTGGHYHYVINYMKGMLAAHGIAVAPFMDAVPICILRGQPCLTDRHAVLPLCVFASQTCLARSWPELARWLDNPDADREAHLEMADRMQRALLAGTVIPDFQPFVLTELAAWHGAADPATGLRFLDVAQSRIGDTWLFQRIRSRLSAKTAAATP